MNRELGLKIATACINEDYDKITELLLSMHPDANANRHTWKKEASLMLDWLKDTTQSPPYSIFTQNIDGKVPFFAFSVLPLVTCPGKGDCANWCYSLKAWRFACAFFRQVQNTILILSKSKHLITAFNALKPYTDIRLYIDGDFDSYETVCFWFELLKTRPDLNAYGYSKSWDELLQYGVFPENYTLNASSGSCHTAEKKTKILKLSRGEFIALPIEKGLQGKYGTKEYKASLRKSAQAVGIDKYFACPGKCGFCTKKGHACGSERFNNIPILIGTH